MPDLGVTEKMTAAANTLTLKETGTYMVSYTFNPMFEAGDATTLTFAVRANEENLDETKSEASAPATTFYANYTGSAIVKLKAGDVIDVAVNSTTPVRMTLDGDDIYSLILYKIG